MPRRVLEDLRLCQYYIPIRIHNWIAKVADLNHTSSSDVIRRILDRYFKRSLDIKYRFSGKLKEIVPDVTPIQVPTSPSPEAPSPDVVPQNPEESTDSEEEVVKVNILRY